MNRSLLDDGPDGRRETGVRDSRVETLDDPLSTFDGRITVKDLLHLLYITFPNGFRSLEANGVLESRFGVRARDGALYQRLTKLGFMTKEPTGYGNHFFLFKVAPQYAKIFENRSEQQLQLEPRRLIDVFIDVEGTGALEATILSNQHFITRMKTVKEKNPELYRKMGGDYLDFLSAQYEESKKAQ